MKKSFELEDLDCANCARKIQELISKDARVNACTVNFISQKMTIEAEDEVFDDVVKMACDAVRKIDPDCSVVV